MKQHDIALMKANAIRLDQARIKRETRALGQNGDGKRALAGILRAPSDSVRRMTLAYALSCAKGFRATRGASYATKILLRAGVSPSRMSKKVGALTDRERHAIADALEALATRGGSRGDVPHTNHQSKGADVLRQGDVLLVPVDELPKGLKKVPTERGRIVLAHGEATGHAHVIEGEATFLAADLEDLEGRFLAVEEEAALVHDEHDQITVPPGAYEVRRQREHEPEAPRYVAD